MPKPGVAAPGVAPEPVRGTGRSGAQTCRGIPDLDKRSRLPGSGIRGTWRLPEVDGRQEDGPTPSRGSETAGRRRGPAPQSEGPGDGPAVRRAVWTASAALTGRVDASGFATVAQPESPIACACGPAIGPRGVEGAVPAGTRQMPGKRCKAGRRYRRICQRREGHPRQGGGQTCSDRTPISPSSRAFIASAAAWLAAAVVK